MKDLAFDKQLGDVLCWNFIHHDRINNKEHVMSNDNIISFKQPEKVLVS